jgi:hypothetical protein
MRRLLTEKAYIFLSTFISFVDVLLRSRLAYRIKSEKRFNPLLVLLNGPSQEDLISHIDCASYDIICVNLFPLNDRFWDIKPRYYTCIDREGMYFNSSDDLELVGQMERTIQSLAKADWELTLLISANDINSDFVSYFHQFNPEGKIFYVNTSHLSGLKIWRNITLKNSLGVFTSRNVSVPAITFAIQLGYQKISILGMDHDWLTQMKVDGDNRIFVNDRHFIAADQNDKNWNVRYHDLLEGFAVIFRAHYFLSLYSEENSIEIVNLSSRSMVDSYVKCQH